MVVLRNEELGDVVGKRCVMPLALGVIADADRLRICTMLVVAPVFLILYPLVGISVLAYSRRRSFHFRRV